MIATRPAIHLVFDGATIIVTGPAAKMIALLIKRAPELERMKAGRVEFSFGNVTGQVMVKWTEEGERL